MRRILSFVLILFSCSVPSLFAVNTFFAPYPSSFNVDLEDTITYCGVPEGETWVGGSAPGYSDKTMVALLDISGAEHPVIGETYNLTFKINSSKSWEYASASEPYLSRPFRLDIVQCTDSVLGTSRELVKSIGFGTSDTDQSVSFNVTIYNYEGWFDIVLVLPELTGVDAEKALAKNDYYAEIEISVKDSSGNSVSPNWPYYINGYIDEEPPVNTSYVMMNVIPTARANSINIDELSSTVPMEVATYFYETIGFMPGGDSDVNGVGGLDSEAQRNVDYYIYASSSRNAFDDSAKEFEMIMAGLEDTDAADEYSFNFKVTMTSSATKNSVTFTGETPEITSMLQSATMEGTTDHHSGNGSSYTVYYYDEGTIGITVTAEEKAKLSSLAPGLYRATVYLHVVSTQ